MNCLSDNDMRNDQSVEYLILFCLLNVNVPYDKIFLYRTNDTFDTFYCSLLDAMQLIVQSI